MSEFCHAQSRTVRSGLRSVEKIDIWGAWKVWIDRNVEQTALLIGHESIGMGRVRQTHIELRGGRSTEHIGDPNVALFLNHQHSSIRQEANGDGLFDLGEHALHDK